MDGKVVVVTGAAGALGKVVAEVALARGARVAGIDHAPSQIAASANRIELGGVDLTDPVQAKTAIDSVAARFGRLDALLNIAGGFAFAPYPRGVDLPPNGGQTAALDCASEQGRVLLRA